MAGDGIARFRVELLRAKSARRGSMCDRRADIFTPRSSNDGLKSGADALGACRAAAMIVGVAQWQRRRRDMGGARAPSEQL